jgi:hypothetical protein
MTIFQRISWPLTGVLTLLLAVNPPVLAQTTLSDLSGSHWAQKPVSTIFPVTGRKARSKPLRLKR